MAMPYAAPQQPMYGQIMQVPGINQQMPGAPGQIFGDPNAMMYADPNQPRYDQFGGQGSYDAATQ